MAPSSSVDVGLRQPFASRTGCSRRHRQYDAYRLRPTPAGVRIGAAEVMGGVVPHDQTWARSEPTTKAGTASCIGSDMSIVGKIDCNGPAQVFGRIEGEVRASD